MKRVILAFGVLGLVGCFLPFVGGLSLFDLRHLDQGWTIWAVLAAFAVPTYVGASRSESDRVAAIAATGAFGYLTYKFGTGVFDLLLHASIGGILIGVAIIGGLTTSLIALAAHEER